MQSVHLQLPADLLARVDEAAGDVPRNRWIRRAIEGALWSIEHPRPRIPANPATRSSPATFTRNLDEISPARSTAQVKRDVQPRPKGGKR